MPANSSSGRLNARTCRGVCIVVGLLSYTPLVHAADKLSGEWNLTLTPDAGGKPFDDLLRFKAGVVGSEFFAKKGFTPAPYETVEPRFGPIKFSSTSKSDAGLLSLQGTVLADSIEGTVAWTDPAGTTTTNWSFKGTRKE